MTLCYHFTVTLTWHASQYKVHKLHQGNILKQTTAEELNSLNDIILLFHSKLFIATSTCQARFTQPGVSKAEKTQVHALTWRPGHPWAERPERTGTGRGRESGCGNQCTAGA